MRLLPLILLLAATPARAAEPAPGLLEALHYGGVTRDDLALAWETYGDAPAAGWAADPAGLARAAEALGAAALDAETPVELLQAAWAEQGTATEAARVEPPPPDALEAWCPRRQDRARLRKLDPALIEGTAHLLAVAAAVEAALPPLDLPTARHAAEVAAAPEERAERFLRDDAAAAAALWDDAAQQAAADASSAALATVLAAGDELSARTAQWPEQPVELWTAAGRVWLGSPGPDRFAAPFVAVIDPGGDDHYDGDGVPQRFAVILDLGGDDRYDDLPAALGGVTLVVDAAGDDAYRGEDLGPAGAAWGAAVLVDRAGDDAYRGGPWSLGAALYGVALLLDDAGDDTYDGAGPCQGAAGPGGAGWLVDRAGDDRYDARGGGAQGHAHGLGAWSAGGLGLLVDGAGEDRYHAGDDAQGHATRGGLGVLLDGGGSDRYAAGRWAQGAARHEALGVLIDGAGDDHYDVIEAGQAAAHDRAAAVLWERGGGDRYQAGGEAQARARGNAVALLLDEGGDDHFAAGGAEGAWGAAAPARGAGSVALLLDAAGDDRFLVPAARADVVARWPDRHGLALDQGLPPRPLPDRATDDLPPATADEVDALLDVAASPAGERAVEALARLSAGGPDTVAPLLARLRADEPATAAVVVAVLREQGSRSERGRAAIASELDAALDPASTGAEAAHLLLVHAAVADDGGAARAIRFLDHDDGRVRSAAAAVLEGTCSDEHTPLLADVLTYDPNSVVRAQAARALGRCPAEGAITPLVAALDADAVAIRDNAARSLVLLAHGGARDAVRDAVRPPAAAGSIPALEVQARVPDAAARPALELLLAGDDPAVRGHAALALGAIGDALSRKALHGREATEPDPFVRLCLDRALRTPGNPEAIAPELP